MCASVNDCAARPIPLAEGRILLIYAWIMLGSALGGSARYFISGLVATQIGETFPWGTLLINVTGSFVIGFFATLTGPDGRVFVGTEIRQFVMVGLCGGYTTFSSFSLQTLNLVRDGEMLRAGGNIGLSVVLCLVAVWLGHVGALQLNLQLNQLQEARP
jgi:CrcB protein